MCQIRAWPTLERRGHARALLNCATNPNCTSVPPCPPWFGNQPAACCRVPASSQLKMPVEALIDSTRICYSGVTDLTRKNCVPNSELSCGSTLTGGIRTSSFSFRLRGPLLVCAPGASVTELVRHATFHSLDPGSNPARRFFFFYIF